MANVWYAQLCREIKRDNHTGLYSLIGSFAGLKLTDIPIDFVFVVYRDGNAIEASRQTFALMVEAQQSAFPGKRKGWIRRIKEQVAIMRQGVEE